MRCSMATFPEALVEAIAQQQLQIAGTPTLSVVSIGPEGYTFDAVIDLYPEVKLGQYKGLRAKCDAVELSDDDVNAALQNYQHAHMLVLEPDVAALGDEVTLDFEGFVDGKAFDGGKGEQFPLLLGSGAFIPGFEEQVVGTGYTRACVYRSRNVRGGTGAAHGTDAAVHQQAEELGATTGKRMEFSGDFEGGDE